MNTACIGVKFCGHCQPQRDMVLVLDSLRNAAPDLCFVPWSTPGWQLLLVLQACDAACAAPPKTDRPIIELVASRLGFVEYDEDDALISALISTLRSAQKGSPC